MQVTKTDVLVIGSGASGLRAAIEAKDNKASVMVVGKCKKGEAHTVMATGGINAALGTWDGDDNWYIHAADTFREGRFLADYRVVETLCKNAPQAIEDLISYGVKFTRDKRGMIFQRFFGAHSYRRTCFAGDVTGRAIEDALLKQAKKRRIEIFQNVFITSLLKAGDKVNGAIGYDTKTGELKIFNCKAVIIATGGHSRLYRRSSSNEYDNNGDGISLAYNAGAELQDMEMLQFHPLGMVHPKTAEGMLVTEASFAEGGRLFNSKNERFMKYYYPGKMELGPRDEIARAIYNEIRAGRGTKHGGVWLDITHLPKSYILERLPRLYKQFRDYTGIDISEERIEVGPTAHYAMGGIRVDMHGATCVSGLFAVGEVRGGVHGANRLGGNSLTETIVYGKITGAAAAKHAAKQKHLLVPSYNDTKQAALEMHCFLGKESARRPQEIKKELQEMMWKNAGIVRTSRDLHRALKQLERIKWKLSTVHTGYKMENNPDYVTALDTKNLVLVAEAVIKSAVIRKESRGAHYRKDYPAENSKWLRNVICKKAVHGVRVHTVKTPRPKGRLVKELKARHDIRTGFIE